MVLYWISLHWFTYVAPWFHIPHTIHVHLSPVCIRFLFLKSKDISEHMHSFIYSKLFPRIKFEASAMQLCSFDTIELGLDLLKFSSHFKLSEPFEQVLCQRENNSIWHRKRLILKFNLLKTVDKITNKRCTYGHVYSHTKAQQQFEWSYICRTLFSAYFFSF